MSLHCADVPSLVGDVIVILGAAGFIIGWLVYETVRDVRRKAAIYKEKK
jgi:hypothetical protein